MTTPIYNKQPFVDIKALSDALHSTVTGVTIEGRAHLVQREVTDFLCQINDTETKVMTAQQVAWFLENNAWEDGVVCEYGVRNSISHLVLPDKDESDLALVQKEAVTLADLYRKGKKRGLISARSSY